MACNQMGARRPTIRDLCSESEMVASTPHRTRQSGPAAWFLEDDDANVGSWGQHHFLDECHMCGKHLAGDDIYMYRGDTAFCSEECRDEQIQIDQFEERAKRRLRRAKAAIPSAGVSPSSSAQVKSRVAAVAVGVM